MLYDVLRRVLEVTRVRMRQGSRVQGLSSETALLDCTKERKATLAEGKGLPMTHWQILRLVILKVVGSSKR